MQSNQELDPDIQILETRLEEETKTPSQKTKKKKSSNKEFARVTYFFVVLFLAMMGYIVFFNSVKSKEIINSPYNVRLDSMADRVVRGKILDSEGNVLAETIVAEDGSEKRRYPYGDLYAHVVGYDSHGKSGLESTENFNLLSSHAFFIERLVNTVQEKKNVGDDVVTTLNTNLQKAAYNALGYYNGAVVVMEASTGKILAMVSKPTYDPNRINKEWEYLTTSDKSELLNRATQGMYAPGSVFKIITALEYIRENKDYDNYSYECTSEIHYEDTTIHCAKNTTHGVEDLKTAFANSCNTAFSDIGLSLDIADYRSTAEDLLFNSKLPSVLPYSQSKFVLDKKSESSEIMMTAMGQGKTQVSPYHMTLISAAIANGGVLMEPYLVDEIVNYTGAIVSKNYPDSYKRIMSSAEATQLKEYMTEVVTSGTGYSLAGESYTVAGKTGTAEYSSDKNKSHSWFTGFSNVDNPELVITVIVEGADKSGMSAVTVAKKVLNAYYY